MIVVKCEVMMDTKETANRHEMIGATRGRNWRARGKVVGKISINAFPQVLLNLC